MAVSPPRPRRALAAKIARARAESDPTEANTPARVPANAGTQGGRRRARGPGLLPAQEHGVGEGGVSLPERRLAAPSETAPPETAPSETAPADPPPSRWSTSRWSKERAILFLEHLARTSNVAASERVAMLPPGSSYRRRRTDAEFARDWQAALREGYARLEEAMLDRAINGVEVKRKLPSGIEEVTRLFSDRIQMRLYDAHKASVLGADAAEAAGSARERLAAKLAEMHERIAGDDD